MLLIQYNMILNNSKICCKRQSGTTERCVHFITGIVTVSTLDGMIVFCNSSLKNAVSITNACLNMCALKITGAMGMENIDLVMYHDY